MSATVTLWAIVNIADELSAPEFLVGFFIASIGTSLPELVTTISCARRNETELIVGNLFGSNMFNSLAVGGAIGLVGPGVILDGRLYGAGAAFMVVIAIGAFLLALNGQQYGRLDGVLLLAAYAVAMLYLGAGAGDVDDELDAGSDPRPAQVDSVAEP